MADSFRNEDYLRNLISQVNMRLFACLGLCGEETRGEAHDRIVQAAGEPVSGLFLPDESEKQAYENILSELEQENRLLVEGAAADGEELSAERLRSIFGLDRNEMFLLTAAIAPMADERFRRIYRLFQGSEEPRQDFLLGLLDPGGFSRYRFAPLLSGEGTLISRGLITVSGGTDIPAPSAVYRPAPGLAEWMNGTRTLSVYGGRALFFEPGAQNTREEPYFGSIAAAVEKAESAGEQVPMVSFSGPDRELLMEHAEALSAEMNRPLLKLSLGNLGPADALPLIRFALRDSALNSAVPVFYDFDDWNDSGILPPELGRLFADWNIPVILLSSRHVAFSPKDGLARRLILRVPVERLTGSRRYTVWKRYLADLPLDFSPDDDELRTLAGQFSLSTAQIRSAVNTGLEIALTANRDLELKDLYAGARDSSMHHLSNLAKLIPSRYTLKDLILPQKQAAEIDSLISMARNRSIVLEDWGVGKKLVSGRGISALFTGVPGTGKTLTAQVIAGELGLELYRVDLSTIISKYIGETEKNLERIFTEAQDSNVILFFDEADSLFGRRSEVNDSHDRYANIEVGYLLQRIETYDGIVLMATNLGANLDEAFARRIHFIIDFPFPDEETRLRLWQLLLPDDIAKDPDIDLAPFAALYKIAGGGIRNAVVWAIYAAAKNKRPLSREDLLHGVEREYQKMGKVFISLP